MTTGVQITDTLVPPCRHDMGWRDITPPPAMGGMWWECNRCHTVCHECGPGSCYKIEGLK